jgi:hypothetical protein
VDNLTETKLGKLHSREFLISHQAAFIRETNVSNDIGLAISGAFPLSTAEHLPPFAEGNTVHADLVFA